MKNPYKILNLSQNAGIAEIARSQMTALRAGIYNNKEISEAQTMLRKPASRLAADFTFPILDKGEVELLSSTIKSEDIDMASLNVNKYDSLK